MTDVLILQLITTITMYCSGPGKSERNNVSESYETACFRKIWTCGHRVKDSVAIVTETHNCITKHVNEKL